MTTHYDDFVCLGAEFSLIVGQAPAHSSDKERLLQLQGIATKMFQAADGFVAENGGVLYSKFTLNAIQSCVTSLTRKGLHPILAEEIREMAVAYDPALYSKAPVGAAKPQEQHPA